MAKMRYTSHVQWHSEDATFKCINCGTSIKSWDLEKQGMKPKDFIELHKSCKG